MKRVAIMLLCAALSFSCSTKEKKSETAGSTAGSSKCISINTEEFNKMMDEYDKALGNIGYEKTDAHNLDELKELKKAAIAYLNAKRAQKGHNTDKPLNFKVDMQMLGREKGGKSIFTSKGKDKYEFALEIVTNIENLENAYGKNEMQKQSAEITQSENGDMEIKEVEQESSEL